MDTAFFILSKLIGLALQVETWLVIGMAVSLVAGRFARPRLARWSGSVTLTALLAFGIFPMGEVLLRPLEAEFPPRAAPAHIDGIVVLGGVEDQRATAAWGEPQLNEAAERLTAAAAIAIAHQEARLVFSGGSGRLRNTVLGHPEIPSVALDFFVSLGIDPDRIIWEDQSRNTAENARFSYEVAAPASGETWVLVTSAFGTVRDLARAVNLAERHVSRQLRLAYLAPDVLKRLVFGREVSAVTVMQLSECAGLPWPDQAGVVFETS